MDTKLILNLLLDHYSIAGNTITQLEGEKDLNYLVNSAQGKFILKIMDVDCDVQLIDFQSKAFKYIQNRNPGIDCPVIILDKNNNDYSLVTINNENRILWLLKFCPGTLLAHFTPRKKEIHISFGKSIAELHRLLNGFTHPFMDRKQVWNLSEASLSKAYCIHIKGETREIAIDVFNSFEEVTSKKLKDLDHGVIHNDANDYNVLVNKEGDIYRVNGIFDFGDMAYQAYVCDIAIALAYAILGNEDPMLVCAEFLKGFNAVREIKEDELELLFDLIKLRLAVSIAISSKRQIEDPTNTYITISQEPAKRALIKLHAISKDFALCYFKETCNYPIFNGIETIFSHLKNAPQSAFIKEIETECVLDLSVGSSMLGAHPKNLSTAQLDKCIQSQMTLSGAKMSIGRYAEARMIYQGKLFGPNEYQASKRRKIHMGLDVFCEAGTKVYAPYDSIVFKVCYNSTPLDYGQLIILKHICDDGTPFYTLYGHLSKDSSKLSKEGQILKAGDHFANIGPFEENGNWPPHLHLQIITNLLSLNENFPGVVYSEQINLWKKLCPNPALLIDKDNPNRYNAEVPLTEIIDRRKKQLGFNLSLSYNEPIHAVNGFKQFLYDSLGQGYLDMYNNVPHVGHSHPKVVEAVQKQVALLNTNTRYLHENILNYSEKLLSKFPASLSVCYFVNSASEANELALRLAKTHTGRNDILVNENAYHGHTSSLIDISPYKHSGPGGVGTPNWVHVADAADDYRGKYRRPISNCGELYADDLKTLISEKKIAAYISETYQSVGGQLIPPPNYVKHSYQYVKENGGINIADEVQTGFGRLGAAWWGFQIQDAVPDIVVLGKPIANGMPMGAVVTTQEIAESFNNGMEFFSTFGGNPVCCAAAEAVLDLIVDEGLLENARILGQELKIRLNKLAEKHSLIGDVRAQGFFLGIELVNNRETKEPAAIEAKYVVNRLKENYILAGVDGPYHNVIKLRPTMITTQQDIDFLISVLESIFKETPLSK